MIIEHGGDTYAYDHPMLDFSVNTNPLGMPRKVITALTEAVAEATRYPDIHNRAIIKALADYHRLPPDMILPGAGGADLIYRFAHAIKPRYALVLAPTFSEYEHAMEQVRTQVFYYARRKRDGYKIDLRMCGHITRDIDAVFLCNPNNPTGVLTDLSTIESIAKTCTEIGAILFIDECFIDFVEGVPTAKHLLAKYPCMVILRAMTKNYAMAGVRIGYVMSANQKLLDAMRRAGPPWQMSCFATQGALAALECRGHLEHTREFLSEERPFLMKALTDLGMDVCRSAAANFVLFDARIPDLKERLVADDILIRGCDNYRGLSRSCYRVAVRTRPDNLRLLDAMGRALGKI